MHINISTTNLDTIFKYPLFIILFMKTILIICAHPDDEVFGMGGSSAIYVKKGYKVHPLICSCGEGSHMWQKSEETAKIRMNESENAAKILETEKPMYLGLKDWRFLKSAKEINAEKKLLQIIRKLKPDKIFTHSSDDLHLDHIAVNTFVMQAIEKTEKKFELYTFDVWNPLTLKNRNNPKLYVDITATFNKKMDAIKCYESQGFMGRWQLTPAIIIRAILYGIQSGNKYAERFTKVI